MTKEPIYKQVIESLREDILNKVPNEPIMSEREIASVFKVSRMTARKAVDYLVNAGYLYRLQNKGTFVAEAYLKKSGKAYIPTKATTYRTLYFNVKEAGEVIGKKLNVEPSELLVIIVRLYLENDIPQRIDEIYFVKKYLETSELAAIKNLLHLDLYKENEKLFQSFIPLIVPIKYTRLLQLEQGTPIIKVENVICNKMDVETLFFISYLNPKEVTIQMQC